MTTDSLSVADLLAGTVQAVAKMATRMAGAALQGEMEFVRFLQDIDRAVNSKEQSTALRCDAEPSRRVGTASGQC